MILISKDRTSASKKINGMALIQTLTVSTTALERTKEKFYGFRQTEFMDLESACFATAKKSRASKVLISGRK